MDIVRWLRNSKHWLNGGECCGQKDSSGTCAAPACIFGEAVQEFHNAADIIEEMRGAARDVLRIADRDTVEFNRLREVFGEKQ